MIPDLRKIIEKVSKGEFDNLFPARSKYDFFTGIAFGVALTTPNRNKIADAFEKYLTSRYADPNHPELDSYGCADVMLNLMKEQVKRNGD